MEKSTNSVDYFLMKSLVKRLWLDNAFVVSLRDGMNYQAWPQWERAEEGLGPALPFTWKSPMGVAARGWGNE